MTEKPTCPMCGGSDFAVTGVQYFEPLKYRTSFACRCVIDGESHVCGVRWFTIGQVRP